MRRMFIVCCVLCAVLLCAVVLGAGCWVLCCCVLVGAGCWVLFIVVVPPPLPFTRGREIGRENGGRVHVFV